MESTPTPEVASQAKTAKAKKPQQFFAYYDPAKETPPRNAKTIFRSLRDDISVEFHPHTITDLTPDELAFVESSRRGQELIDSGAIKMMDGISKEDSTFTHLKTPEEARKAIFNTADVNLLRLWRGKETRSAVRDDINRRIREINYAD